MFISVLYTVAIFLISCVQAGVNEYYTNTYEWMLHVPSVPRYKTDVYFYTPYKVPKTKTSFIVGFKPLVDESIAHHADVHGCEELGPENGGGNRCIKGYHRFFAWSNRAPELELPEGTGFKIGNGSNVNYLILEVHFSKINTNPDESVKKAGILLTLTDDWLPHSAKMTIILSTGMIRKLPIEYFDISCEVTEKLKAIPFAFRVHTHAHGIKVSGYLVKKDSNGNMTWHLIGEESPQKPQNFFPVLNPDLVIENGDMLAAQCIYRNPEEKEIPIGSTNKDEMCNFYILYRTLNEKQPYLEYCIGNGPPYSWSDDMNNVPKRQIN